MTGAPGARLQVALTGRAVRTPLGSDIAAVVERLLAGDRAAERREGHARLPADACRLWARVSDLPRPSRHGRFLGRLGHLGVEVGHEAFAAARIAPGERLGIFSAVGGPAVNWDAVLPALRDQRSDGAGVWSRGLGRLHPFWLLQYLSNAAQALCAGDLGATGEGVAFGGPTAGVQALGSAAQALCEGTLDAAIVIAHDGLLEPESLCALAASGVVTSRGLADLVAPYGAGASGVVPGEAAAAVVLESVERAGARALARVDVSDTADGSEGQPAAATFARALRAVSRPGERALVVDGAARATETLDQEERALVAEALGEHCLLTAITSALGEPGCAKPLLQLVTLAELLRLGLAPPVAGLVRPAPGPLTPLTAATRIRTRVAIGLVTGAPGAAGAIRVEL